VSRRIILLSDGTGNSAGKLFKTNVWRFYQALDLSSAHQIAYYDDGIGSSSFKPIAMVGGAFGWGLTRNVLNLYAFLCRNYSDGDRIYGFGFSRGAFTIRVLVQFVLAQGLVTNFASNDELRVKARFLYREFRRSRTTQLGTATAARGVRDLILRGFEPDEIKTISVEKVRFLGLWDTVDAYGLPIEELQNGVDRYLWPLALHDSEFDLRIEKACHALSIDDQRANFHPLLWNEEDEARFPQVDRTDDEALTQVWFAGVHANVGGGYPDDGLSSVSLKWVIGEAKKAGLTFSDTAVKTIEAAEAPYGRLYDSRVRLGAYYRYGPRRLDPPYDKQGARIPHPKIHESVIWRIAVGTDAYAPISLPQQIRVVTDLYTDNADGPRPAPLGADVARQSHGSNIHTLDDYRTLGLAERSRFFSGTDEAREAANVLSRLKAPEAPAVDLIWDTVSWRRFVYFTTLIVTTFLVLYPFLPDSTATLYTRFYTHEKITGLQDLAHVPATLLADVLSGFVPGIAKPWIEAFRTYPVKTSSIILVIAMLFIWGKVIDRRIQDRALSACNAKWRDTRLEWLRRSVSARFVSAAGLIVLAAGGLAASSYMMGHPAPSELLSDGPKCKITPCPEATDIFLKDGSQAVGDVGIRSFFAAMTALFGLLLGASVVWLLSLKKLQDEVLSSKAEVPGFALWVAHRVRTSRLVIGVQRFVADVFVPGAFALVILWLALVGLSRLSFAIASAGGWICVSHYPVERLPDNGRALTFELGRGCHGSRLALLGGEKYRIEINSADRWRKGNLKLSSNELSPRGFSTPWQIAPDMLLALPMRRHLSENWFVPIARVGAVGSDEHVLDARVTIIEPRRAGELFVYVNDAAIGFPYVWDLFYRKNAGTISITVQKLASSGPVE
jgi:uncharacterized protein (DUF2235 family)